MTTKLDAIEARLVEAKAGPWGWTGGVLVRQAQLSDLLAAVRAAVDPYDPLDDGEFYRWQKNLAAALAPLLEPEP